MLDGGEVVSLDAVFPSGVMEVNNVVTQHVFHCSATGFDFHQEAPYGITEVI